MSLIASLTAKNGPIDQARYAAERIGARPYRLLLCWSAWKGGEVGDGPEKGPVRYEIRPRPKITGYAGLTRNPTVIGTVPSGIVRVEEVPLWLPWAVLKGRQHPERGEVPDAGDGVQFWYEIDVADSADPTFKPQVFRLSAEPERDEERGQWVLVLERQASRDR